MSNVECMSMNVLVGSLDHFLFEFVILGLLSGCGCWMLGMTLVPGPELFVTGAGQEGTTTCLTRFPS